MTQKWNRICTKLKRLKDSSCTEKEYENKVRECFDYLLDWDDEVKTQVHIPIGSAMTLIPDIIISSDNIYQFVIELKKPTNVLTERQCIQLFSYMKQLKLDYGLYVGENIQLYYDHPDDKEDPVLIKTFEFKEDTNDGLKFIELFERKTFSQERLREYCECILDAKRQEEELKRDLNVLFSEQGEEILKGLVIDYLVGKGYIREIIEINMKGRTFSGRESNIKSERSILNCSFDDSSTKVSSQIRQKRKQYSLNGTRIKGCGRLALAIVKKFVQDNPDLSYSEIQKQLPEWAKIKTPSEIDKEATGIHAGDKRYKNRWYLDSTDMICSSDGKVFALTHEWSAKEALSSSIQPMIEFARKHGYTIEELE